MASADTHDRFVTYHAEQQREVSPWSIISPDVFTFASVDNFDMLQTHAAVYSGQQHRSYHGTTVQLVQPKSTLIFSEPNASAPLLPTSSLSLVSRVTVAQPTHGLNTVGMEEATNRQPETTFPPVSRLPHHLRPGHSPSNSPHKLGKIGPKRLRTVAFRHLASALSSHEQVLSIRKNSRLKTLEKLNLK